MVTDQGSLTAMVAAACRAVESRKPAGERLLDDPYAEKFVTERGWEFFNRLEEVQPGAQLLHILRTNAAEEHVRQEVVAGARQVVIHGAGYDCSALRLKELRGGGTPQGGAGPRVFEVDEPYTSELKQAQLKEILGALPPNVTYVAVDFVQETLDDLQRKLLESGYDLQGRTVFLLGSVIMYLTAEAVDYLFRFMASNSGKGSSVVFTNIDVMRLKEDEARGSASLSKEIAQAGEPFQFGLGPEEIEGYLSLRGYHRVRWTSMRELKEGKGATAYPPFDFHYYVVRAWVDR